MNTRTLLFSGAILVSAVTTIGWPDLRLGPVLAAYVFTPLTTMLIMVLAATGPGPGSVRYRWSIVTGLACSLTGDVLLMLPRQSHRAVGTQSRGAAKRIQLLQLEESRGLEIRERMPGVSQGTVAVAGDVPPTECAAMSQHWEICHVVLLHWHSRTGVSGGHAGGGGC